MLLPFIISHMCYCGQLAGGTFKTQQSTDTVDNLPSLQKWNRKKTMTPPSDNLT